ncbi:MAG TPA: dTDP-4-dehydrorhamnose reductase [Candidatus Dormibacteraeota bacterium]
MRLLVTGAQGQLGSEFVEAARTRGLQTVALSHADCDIRDTAAVAAMLDAHAVDALVNCAAWRDVDGAESHRHEAYAVNAVAPGTLAVECARRTVMLVHLSTDYVFDGAATTAVDEEAPAVPRSVYGASKLAGEEAIRATGARHLIVRTSALYGRDGPNFVLTVLQRAAAEGELRVVADQVTSPTWTAHLAAALVRLLEHRAVGTYHVTGWGSTSWDRFAATAVELAGLPATVRPISSEELANTAWRRLGEPPLPPWQTGLSSYIAELRRRGRLPRAAGHLRTA